MVGSEGWRTLLREARRRLGITRLELAERAGLSPDTIRAYELGRRRPRRDHLELIVARSTSRTPRRISSARTWASRRCARCSRANSTPLLLHRRRDRAGRRGVPVALVRGERRGGGRGGEPRGRSGVGRRLGRGTAAADARAAQPPRRRERPALRRARAELGRGRRDADLRLQGEGAVVRPRRIQRLFQEVMRDSPPATRRFCRACWRSGTRPRDASRNVTGRTRRVARRGLRRHAVPAMVSTASEPDALAFND